MSKPPRPPSGVERLGIGVGRFGAPASARTRRGPSEAEAFAMIALAAEAGVRLIDTAGDLPRSEQVLGMVLPRAPTFEITTKTAGDGGLDGVLGHVRASLARLAPSAVRAVLVRPATMLFGDEGPRLWAGLRAMQAQGLFAAVGICACVCDDPVGLARRFRPDLMQLPLSLLDQRLLANGALGELAAMGVELHLRSIFLRGLLFDPGPAAEPPQLMRLRRRLAEAGADPMQAALAFTLERPEASRVIVGVASPLELRAVLAAARAPRPALDWDALKLDTGPCRLDPRACRAA